MDFKLRQNDVNRPEFTEDETHVKDIKGVQAEKLLTPVVNQIIETTGIVYLTDELKALLTEYLKWIPENIHLCAPKNRGELSTLLANILPIAGNECDLNWIDVSQVTDMSNLFSFSHFNGDISKWDTHNVQTMSMMFFRSVFNGDISKWDTHNVTDMGQMFRESKFNGDISRWDVSNVTNISQIFYQSAFNQDISDWDVHNILTMYNAFKDGAFKQDLSKWHLSSKCIMNDPFDNDYPDEFLPIKLVIESINHNFKLHNSDSRDIQFDNDEVSPDDIRRTQLKLKLTKLLDKALSHGGFDLCDTDKEFLFNNIDQFENEPFYRVKNRPELVSLTTVWRWHKGNECNLNWIDTSDVKDMSWMFNDSEFNGDISMWNTSNVTNMSWMFNNNKVFNKPIGNWDMHNVINMHGMFWNCPFNGDISKWNVSNVENMNSMFGDSEFNGDISRWDVSNVKDMYQMFAHSQFNSDISNWDVSNVMNLDKMFYNTIFDKDISGWNLNPKATKSYMFGQNYRISAKHMPKALQHISEALSNFNLRRDNRTNDTEFDDDNVSTDEMLIHQQDYLRPIIDDILAIKAEQEEQDKFKKLITAYTGPAFYTVQNMSDLKTLIHECCNILGNKCDLNWIDMSQMTDLTYLFWESEFNGNISKWDVSNVKIMKGLFQLSKFNGDISNWNVSNVTDMNSMFYKTVFNGDISKWNVSGVTDMSGMFEESEFTGDISKWDISSLKTMNCMFQKSKFNGDISKWDVSNVWSMYKMFQYAIFNGDISEWNVENVTDMESMFDGSKFNQDISNWVITDTTTHNMFKDCPIEEEHKPKIKIIESVSNFNLRRDNRTGEIDFDDEDTDANDIAQNNLDFMLSVVQQMIDGNPTAEQISKFKHRLKYFNKPFYKPEDVTELSFLISCAEDYLGLDCDLNWIDVHHITNMSKLFAQSNFNGDISKWDVSNVTDMDHMFTMSKFNGDISKWDVSKVDDMGFMFYSSEFDQDISSWNVSAVELMNSMFTGSKFNQDISAWDISKVRSFSYMFANSSFDSNVSNWDVSKAKYYNNMFDNTPMSDDYEKWPKACVEQALSTNKKR